MKVNDDFSVDFLDYRKEIASALQGLTFDQTMELWRELENEFKKQGIISDLYRNLCLEDRFFLMTMVLGRQDAMKPWVFDRCREVEKDPNGHLDLWAREHFKSSVITHAGGIQEILKDREITIGIFSHTKSIARKFLRQIKHDLESRASLKNLFPDVLYQNPSRESTRWTVDAGIIVRRAGNPKEATVEAWGVVDGQPTGAHFKLRIYDDLVTAESVTTPEQIQKTTDMLALSDNLGSEGGRVWFIGTRYGSNDTYQDMINRNQVKTRIYPATDDGTFNGKPVLLSEEYWESKKRSQTMSTIACQMLQNPLAGSQAMFDPMTFNTYKIRPETLNIYILVDPASSMKKGSDKTAMVVIGVDSQLNKFLLDGYHHKMQLTEKWQKLSGLYRKWRKEPGVQGVYVGYEKFGMQSDIEYFNIQMEQEEFYFEIEEVSWPRQGSASKVDRIGRLEPDFRNGKLFLPSIIYDDGKIYKWGFIDPSLVREKLKMIRDIAKNDVKNGTDSLTPRHKSEFKMLEKVENECEGKNAPFQHRIILTKQMVENDMDLRGRNGARPIKKKNEEGRIYDLTVDFINQAITIPFAGGHDDLVDAASRIYDMKLIAPMIIRSSYSEPTVYDDGF